MLPDCDYIRKTDSNDTLTKPLYSSSIPVQISLYVCVSQRRIATINVSALLDIAARNVRCSSLKRSSGDRMTSARMTVIWTPRRGRRVFSRSSDEASLLPSPPHGCSPSETDTTPPTSTARHQTSTSTRRTSPLPTLYTIQPQPLEPSPTSHKPTSILSPTCTVQQPPNSFPASISPSSEGLLPSFPQRIHHRSSLIARPHHEHR
jgi:hypothetical protein